MTLTKEDLYKEAIQIQELARNNRGAEIEERLTDILARDRAGREDISGTVQQHTEGLAEEIEKITFKDVTKAAWVIREFIESAWTDGWKTHKKNFKSDLTARLEGLLTRDRNHAMEADWNKAIQACIDVVNGTGDINPEVERAGLRQKQAKATMPFIGHLLDVWDELPNDIKLDAELRRVAHCINKIDNAMENIDKVNKKPNAEG